MPTNQFNSIITNTFYPDTRKIKNVFHKLDAIRMLQTNRDSYDAKKPSLSAISSAQRFLMDYRRLDLPCYFTSPGVNGEVVLEFKAGNKSAEIYFNPDGSPDFYFYDGINLVNSLESGFALNQLIQHFENNV